MGPITEEEFRKAITDLYTSATKTCDVLRQCNAPASWFVNFHGCDGVVTCDKHKKDWVWETLEKLGQQGAVPCTKCGEEFTNITEIMTWSKI